MADCSHLTINFALTSTEPDDGPRWECSTCGERFVPVSRLRDRATVEVVDDLLYEFHQCRQSDSEIEAKAVEIVERLIDIMGTT